MTVDASPTTRPAAAACHGHGAAADQPDRHTDRDRATGSFRATLLALPRSARIGGGALIGVGVLLAIGVPLASLVPLLALGGCLGMHLFMGHGAGHGGGHAAHGDPQPAVDRAEPPAADRDAGEVAG